MRLSVVFFVLFALSSTSVQAQPPRYLTNFDISRLLREDCREIVRKAKFYISARCSFKVLAVDRGGPGSGTKSGLSSRTPLADGTPGSQAAAIEESDVDSDLTTPPGTREERVSAVRRRAQALLDENDINNVPLKGKFSHKRVLVKSKGFIRDVTFEVVYRFKWSKNTSHFTRRVLKVLPAHSSSLSSGSRSAIPSQQTETRRPSTNTSPAQ